jgi:hypothetical protein
MPPQEIPDELIDQLLAGREGPESITGPDGNVVELWTWDVAGHVAV